ncbi:MAG: hypothetical protein JWM53_4507 [bacterium]|nr:hypothetical protein [bacterium]
MRAQRRELRELRVLLLRSLRRRRVRREHGVRPRRRHVHRRRRLLLVSLWRERLRRARLQESRRLRFRRAAVRSRGRLLLTQLRRGGVDLSARHVLAGDVVVQQRASMLRLGLHGEQVRAGGWRLSRRGRSLQRRRRLLLDHLSDGRRELALCSPRRLSRRRGALRSCVGLLRREMHRTTERRIDLPEDRRLFRRRRSMPRRHALLLGSLPREQRCRAALQTAGRMHSFRRALRRRRQLLLRRVRRRGGRCPTVQQRSLPRARRPLHETGRLLRKRVLPRRHRADHAMSRRGRLSSGRCGVRRPRPVLLATLHPGFDGCARLPIGLRPHRRPVRRLRRLLQRLLRWRARPHGLLAVERSRRRRRVRRCRRSLRPDGVALLWRHAVRLRRRRRDILRHARAIARFWCFTKSYPTSQKLTPTYKYGERYLHVILASCTIDRCERHALRGLVNVNAVPPDPDQRPRR